VYVQSMGHTKKDKRKVSSYIATQYLADQHGATVRMSYSWWRSSVALGRAWAELKRYGKCTWWEAGDKSWHRADYHPKGPDGSVRNNSRGCWRSEYVVTFAELVRAWEELLQSGEAMLGEKLLLVRDRTVVEAF